MYVSVWDVHTQREIQALKRLCVFVFVSACVSVFVRVCVQERCFRQTPQTRAQEQQRQGQRQTQTPALCLYLSLFVVLSLVLFLSLFLAENANGRVVKGPECAPELH